MEIDGFSMIKLTIPRDLEEPVFTISQINARFVDETMRGNY